jgi:hypothetical protein
VAIDSNEVDEIRRQMALIRHNLHTDVQEVVAGAGEVANWRRYVRSYPWVAVGLAFAAGYLIVPRRRRKVPADLARKADVHEILQEVREADRPEQKPGKSLVGMAFGMLAPLAWRVAQNYAMSFLDQWIIQQQQHAMAEPGRVGSPWPPSSPSQSPSAGPVKGRTRRPSP